MLFAVCRPILRIILEPLSQAMRQQTPYKSLCLDIEAALDSLVEHVNRFLEGLNRTCRPQTERILEAIQHVLFADKRIRAKQVEAGCFVDCVLVSFSCMS